MSLLFICLFLVCLLSWGNKQYIYFRPAAPNTRARDRYWSVSRLVLGHESRGSGVKFLVFMVFIAFERYFF